MRCPGCGHAEDKVVDSRVSKDADAIRRRRECLECGQRFTTYERVERPMPMVVKRDDRREPFHRQKLMGGLQIACQKRPVSTTQLEAIVTTIVDRLLSQSADEVESARIGDLAMVELRSLDDVAYLRFASVYQSYQDIAQFLAEVERVHEAPSGSPGSVK